MSTSPAPSRSSTSSMPRDISSRVAKALYGLGTDLAEQWGKQRRDELDQCRINALLDALRVHAETCEEARKCIDFIARNRHRMHYPTFRATGLCVSTGVVEAGCRTIAGTRLKRSGDALDRRRRQRHPRPAMRHPQQPLRRLLGTQSSSRAIITVSQI